jgi:SecY interacting protein Syd
MPADRQGVLRVDHGDHDSTDHPVALALDRFVARHARLNPTLLAAFDAEWRSPCELAETAAVPAGQVSWRPLRRTVAVDLFTGLQNALGQPIHPDIKAYYGRYWSGELHATAADGHVSLLQIWNDDDADRLIENLIGHALAKRRLRSPFTVFFACTEPDSELFLSVDSASGRVLLEAPGQQPLRVVADDLATFIDALQPAPADPGV